MTGPDLVAALLALLAGALFGLTVHVQKSALAETDEKTGAFLTVLAMAAMFWVLSPWFIDWSWWGTRAAAIFALCGLIFPAASQRLQVVSVMKIGPQMASAFGSIAPLFAALPAILFLGEEVSLQGWAGIALVISGLIVSALRPGRGMARTWPLWLALLPLGASAARGVVQPAAKFGFAEVNSPFFASMVMCSVSTLVLGVVLLEARRRPSRRYRTPRGTRLFMVNGIIIGLGILALQSAISRGAVTLAAPLASTAPLWSLLFGVTIFRNEHLGPRHLIMALMVVGGTALIVTR